MSGHAHMSVGKLDVALANLAQAWQILGQLDYRDTKQGYDTCGLLASAQLRSGAVDEAAGTLSQCPQDEGAPNAIMRMQAQAELHFARGQTREAARLRSEEHTSELQSLMRISYAVFCLKKNNKYNRRHRR